MEIAISQPRHCATCPSEPGLAPPLPAVDGMFRQVTDWLDLGSAGERCDPGICGANLHHQPRQDGSRICLGCQNFCCLCSPQKSRLPNVFPPVLRRSRVSGLPLITFSPKVVFDQISRATAPKPSSETSPSEPLHYLTRNCRPQSGLAHCGPQCLLRASPDPSSCFLISLPDL